MRGLLLLLGLVAVVPAVARAQDATSIVGRSSRVYRSLSSLSADFVQVIDNPMIDSAESRGTLVQAGPDKLSMRFTDPDGEAVVIDGRSVWVYTPSTTPGQVIRMAVPSGGPVYGYNLLAWFLDRPAERYTASYLRADVLGGRSMDVVELVPAVPDLPFERAVLWLDRADGIPRRLEITEHSGALRTLTLSKVRVNQSVPDRTFTFQVPSGVRVVDQ
ncbi:MAG TPA: outer membrane lipoprotein carrier protein LolA [Gemmatimonadales bacterium]|jgi:outer membrane lipoprotein carrier protein|nr:outer membrane lipoprotein carrier protein LolA [Gemmatimonadales bacterium]